MRELRSGLWAMESPRMSAHGYLLTTAGRVFLVDPGMSFDFKVLSRELAASGRSPRTVTDILLTHYDIDHASSAAEWQRRTGATVWLGAEDAEILRSGTAPATRFRRIMARWLPTLPANVVELRGEVTIAPGLTAVPTPGHTPGHYAFLWEDVALIGDVAVGARNGELRSDGFRAADAAQADATMAMVEALPVRAFCPGHGHIVERTL